MKEQKQLISIGVVGAIAVASGALGAHALKNQLPGGLITPDQLDGFDTAVKYQMYHVLAMLAVVLLQKQNTSKLLNLAFNFFFFGIILFSGSLYFLCTRNLLGADWLKFLGPVTPIGGLSFVVGWLLMGLSAIKKS
jgi:uncharacterized membrane protein YgdD (TMEM256/DUF423 family)